MPEPDLGERLAACIRQAPGTPAPDLRELTAFLASRRGLERRELPELLLRVEEMPLGPSGKVCRGTLLLAARETSAPRAKR
ncbi:hypothetical protein [Streptomyces sp. NPDC050416]|uniref:hypothetical protein n=1 Tax=Streptomyces sp. NPDC050416 TaxID=3365611 RepID=UPI0037A0D27F